MIRLESFKSYLVLAGLSLASSLVLYLQFGFSRSLVILLVLAVYLSIDLASTTVLVEIIINMQIVHNIEVLAFRSRTLGCVPISLDFTAARVPFPLS